MPSPFFFLVADHDREVSPDTGAQNAHSESALAVNPVNPLHMVGASKEFRDIVAYKFTLVTYASFDGGRTWTKGTPPIPQGVQWDGTTDPAVAFDDLGNVYLVALPYSIAGTKLNTFGMVIYTSQDGINWGHPQTIDTAQTDDKQTACADGNPASPHHGNVYAAWGNGVLRFARRLRGATSWIGAGTATSPTPLVGPTKAFAPEMAITPDGTLYLFWLEGAQIQVLISTDGGTTFTQETVATPNFNGQVPGASFRIPPVPCASPGRNGTAIVAWADFREGPARIYYARKSSQSAGWTVAPLFTPGTVPADQHDIMPQVDSWRAGDIGCAFYRFGPKPAGTNQVPTIDVITAVSVNDGASFDYAVTTTVKPWDPTLDEPRADANPAAGFIGDYFGFAASPFGWHPFWTDTRTGDQEIFTTRVHWQHNIPFEAGLVNWLIGSLADGPLWRLTPHGIVPFGPLGPDGPLLHEGRIRELADRTKAAIRQVAHGLSTLRAINAELDEAGQEGR